MSLSPPAAAVLAQIETLDDADLRALYQRLGRLLGLDDPLPMDEIRERRFAQRRACPHCGSDRVQRHGRYQ